MTTQKLREEVQTVTDSIEPNLIKVFTVKRADKRTQLCKGINHAKGSIVALRYAFFNGGYCPHEMKEMPNDHNVSAVTMMPCGFRTHS